MNNKIDKIIVLNPHCRFEPKSVNQNLSIPVEWVESYECCMTTDKNGVKLFLNNKEIKFDNAYLFIRSWGTNVTDKHFVSIIGECARRLNINYSSDIFRYHSKSASKITQMPKFAIANLPIKDTIIARETSYKANESILKEKISYPCVFKRKGSQGKAVWKVENEKELKELISSSGDDLFLIQDLIETPYDIRVLVFDGEVIGAIKRHSENDFVNNISAGGEATSIELQKEEIDLAIQASRTASVNFAGVDLMRDGDQTYIIEVNRCPGFDGFEDVHNFSVTEKVLKNIIQKYA